MTIISGERCVKTDCYYYDYDDFEDCTPIKKRLGGSQDFAFILETDRFSALYLLPLLRYVNFVCRAVQFFSR